MVKTERKFDAGRLTLLFALVYMISYMTRINYGAVISEIESDTGIQRSLLSMALTGSFITYGAGQIVSGILGDKISPKKLVLLGLITSSLMNILIPLCGSPYIMCAVWCVNGFAQSFMWPPLVKLMTNLLSPDDYKKASATVSFGASMGTICIYLLSPLMISIGGWSYIFFFSAVCGIIMIFIWAKLAPDTDTPAIRSADGEGSRSFSLLFNPLMLSVMLAIILQGMLRDGVTTWMPSYISETYSLSNVVSILTGIVMPLFGILCYYIGTKLYMYKFKNPLLCAGIFFGIGAVSSLILVAATGKSAFISVVCSAMLTGAMHGANLILVCMIPPFFKKQGKVSTVSGIINSCTYIGSAVSTYGIALISEKTSWNVTVIIWSAIAITGTLVCLFCVHPWKKRYGG